MNPRSRNPVADSTRSDGPLALYGELAPWWPLLSRPEDYAEEANFYYQTLAACCETGLSSLLELGSGGGNNASHLKRWIENLTLVDRSEGMLSVSRALNPRCQHVIGDMRTVRLGREFDGVFVHDAICYMTTVDELRSVLDTALVHTRRGGCALFAPDFVAETFRPSTGHGGHDGATRSLRYLEWTWDPDPSDTEYVVDMAYLLREGDGEPRVVRDRHLEGLFSRQVWMELLGEVGFEPERHLIRHSELPAPIDVFVGRRTASST